METKELIRDNYVKTQQVASVQEKFRVPYGYVGTINASPNTITAVIPAEELQGYGYDARLGVASSIIIAREKAVIQEEPFAYGTDYEEANLWTAVEELPRAAYPVFRFIGTSVTAPSPSEEIKQLVRRQIQDRVEIYPDYWVSSAEYERRFKGVNLDHFRKVLPPDLFKAYVHTMGSVEGLGIEPRYTYKGKD